MAIYIGQIGSKQCESISLCPYIVPSRLQELGVSIKYDYICRVLLIFNLFRVMFFAPKAAFYELTTVKQYLALI